MFLFAAIPATRALSPAWRKSDPGVAFGNDTKNERKGRLLVGLMGGEGARTLSEGSRPFRYYSHRCAMKLMSFSPFFNSRSPYIPIRPDSPCDLGSDSLSTQAGAAFWAP